MTDRSEAPDTAFRAWEQKILDEAAPWLRMFTHQDGYTCFPRSLTCYCDREYIFRAGYAAALADAEKVAEGLHHPSDEIYEPYGRCSPDCMALDYADAIAALAREKK